MSSVPKNKRTIAALAALAIVSACFIRCARYQREAEQMRKRYDIREIYRMVYGLDR